MLGTESLERGNHTMIRSIRSVRSLCIVVIAMFAVAIAAPAAFAQDPTDEQYGNGVLGVAAGGDPADGAAAGDGGAEDASASAGISELPFTGLDVAAIAAIGAGLIGAGFVVRRAAHSADDTV